MVKLKPYEEYREVEYDWLNKIPVHWKGVPIKSLVEQQNKRNGQRKDLELLSVYREFGVIKKASRDDNHNVESEDLSNYKYVNTGYLVLNKMKVWQGSLGVSRYEGIVSPAYIVCKIISDVNLSYINYLLRDSSYKTIYNRLSYGVRVDQWDIRYDDFKNIPIFLPPKAEQDQIAKFLDNRLSKINRFIKSKKSQIELLKELKQAIINQAVTKGIDPNVPMKYSGVEWIGGIPEHWEVRKLRNILIPNNKRNRPDLPLLSVVRDKGVIIRDVLDIESNHNYIPDDLSNYKVVEKGQFAMNKMKAWQGSYGISEYSGIVSPAYFVFDVEFDNLEYFHNALRSKIYVNFFAKASDGIRIGQWDLSLQNMKEIALLVPPYEEQEIIVTYIRKKAKAIDDTISAIQSKIDLVTEYRTSLISAVVTGKVDVRHIPIKDTDEFIEDMVDEEESEDAFEEEIGEEDKEVLICQPTQKKPVWKI